MAQRTIGQLDAITTPNDAADVWVQDSGVSPPDRKWSLTNVLSWLRGKFGTAVDSDVQTSLTDTTADRLMKVGAFGLGDSSVDVGDVSQGTSQVSKLIRTATTDGAIVSGYGLQIVQTGNYAFRIYGRDGTAVCNFIEDGVVSDHYEILHSGNYPSDTAWTKTTSLDNGWTGEVRYIKRAGWVTVTAQLDGTSGTDPELITLPSDYHPGVNINGAGRGTSFVQIVNDGRVQCETGDGNTRFTFTYPVI